jgi:diguanylate cyclase (GGDEF)-like protein
LDHKDNYPLRLRILPPAKPNRDLERLTRENASLKREIARLEVYRAMAYRDPLTGLWNRRYFEDRLQEELSRSRRAGPQRRFSLMAIDLDDFKRVNDVHGHAAGDLVLKEVGEFLIAHLRNHDIACRTGGDEFTVILPDLSAADCGSLVERLRGARTSANLSQAVPVSLSFGTASWPESGDAMDELRARADEAMYADKRLHKPGTSTAAAARPRTRRVTSRVRTRATLA